MNVAEKISTYPDKFRRLSDYYMDKYKNTNDSYYYGRSLAYATAADMIELDKLEADMRGDNNG